MANENSIDVYHALMALEEKVTGVAPDPENVTTDVALALADIFRTDAPMAQETAIVNAIDTITANYGGGGGGDTTDFWLWNSSEDAGAVTQYVGVSRATGIDIDNNTFITEPCEVEQVTTTYSEQTVYGVHVTDVPVGSAIVIEPPQSFNLIEYGINYTVESFPPIGPGNFGSVPSPIEGFVIGGSYSLESTI